MGDLQPLAGRAGLSAGTDRRGGGAEEDAVLHFGARVFLRGGVRAVEGRREGVNQFFYPRRILSFNSLSVRVTPFLR